MMDDYGASPQMLCRRQGKPPGSNIVPDPDVDRRSIVQPLERLRKTVEMFMPKLSGNAISHVQEDHTFIPTAGFA
jgi:hypothetical protein